MSLNDYDKLYDEKKAVLKLIRDPFYWIEELTDRQREALNLACRGSRAPQIAEEMGLKVRSATGLISRAVKVVNEAMKWNIKPPQLTDKLLTLLEKELDDG